MVRPLGGRVGAARSAPRGVLVRGATERQRDVLRSIADFEEANGFPPSIRDLCTLLEISSTNGVNDHLKALERKSLVERDPTTARSIRLTHQGRLVLGASYCPTCGGLRS